MMKNVRVICLIPSMTETLIECGVNIVGRTRYCIHPESIVKTIPILGGTKRVQKEELEKLNPDLVILDREENTKEMAQVIESLQIKMHVMHVTSLESLAKELGNLGLVLKNQSITELSHRGSALLKWRSQKQKDLRKRFLELSAMSDNPWGQNTKLEVPQKLNYVIWKKPWMIIGPETYIQDVLSFAGFQLAHEIKEKYPKIDQLPFEPTLFSSEPYPFDREWDEMQKTFPQSLLVDGEKISWFGIRNLQFLELLIDPIEGS